MSDTEKNTTEQNISFINRCDGQIYENGIDLDDDDRLLLYRLAGYTSEPPNHRAGWPPYADMIADARRMIAL